VTGRQHLPTLTGLRFLAALVVFGYHAVILLAGSAEGLVRAVFDHGRLGVSFFFLLSGFIVTWAWRSGDTAGAFWRRRLARIYPSYLVALVAAAVVLRVVGPRPTAGVLGLNALLLQSWVPERSVFFGGNDVGWSLSCEAFFYAAFPALLAGLAKLDARARRVLQAVVVVLVVAVGIWAAATVPDDYFGAGGPTVFVAYVFPPVRALEFVLGITLALDLKEGRRLRVPWGAAVALAALAYTVARLVPTGLDFAAVTIVPFALLLQVAAQRDLDGRPTVFAHRWVVVLGEWSFCFYLVHRLVMLAVLHVSPPSGGVRGLAVLAGCFVLALAAAWLLHAAVEKPAYRRLRGRSRTTLPVSMRDVDTPV